jgi:hypothetical protein
MKLQLKSPIQIINRSYRREIIQPEVFEVFINALENYFYYVNRSKEVEETTANTKKYLGDFLNIFYPNFNQHTKSYNPYHEASWVISNTETQTVQLLFGIQEIENTAEMITVEKPNKKIFQELLLSYLYERIVFDNHEIKYLVLTNMESFFLFDTDDFYRIFCKNSTVLKEFDIWKDGQLDAESTKKIYKFLKKFLDNYEFELPTIHFNLLKIQSELSNYKQTDNKNLRAEAEYHLAQFYKIFSPKFLLKQAINNNSNELNQAFYFELLHILGLEEATESNKKIITRCTNPEPGSLLENTITKLRTEDLLYSLGEEIQYGKTDEERYFNVAFELVITWLNRILFLKILEAQLTVYNSEDDDKAAFMFLHPDKIIEFDTLNTLFFEVLALPEKERELHVSKEYNRIPYLNSSLFEVTDLERKTLRISNLKDSTLLPIFEESVLKTVNNKNELGTDNQFNKQPTLKYLLDFLEAHDFGIEASESIIKSETKPIINTTILGLILEKINGYKEGLFFTPRHVSMQMSRETLRKIVVDKFNNKTIGFGLAVTSFEEVQHFCRQLHKANNLAKANTIINSITICDPAVGSGHLLVSVLNELLVIKSELGILCDLKGNSLVGKINLKIENDELIIYDNLNIPFVYKVSFSTGLRKLLPDLQQIQETIFHEKKHLIEHCLFGVDINPNSVRICRLRLWIELLKNAYYRQGRNTQLETLPNIDINIKTGNSLISRFALNADLNDVFRKTEYSVEEYKRSVKAYKIEANKSQKRDLSEYLEEIKTEFQITFDRREREKISKVRGKKDQLKLQIKYNRNLGYEPTPKELEDLEKFTNNLLRREKEKSEILSSDIYRNAFEWRFEFPEILDEHGNFIGFDIIISNPPYTKSTLIKPMKLALKKVFQLYQSNADLYIYFFELSQNLVQKNGAINLLTPNNWLHIKAAKNLRNMIAQKAFVKITDYGKQSLFDDFSTTTAITHFSNKGNITERDFSTIEIEKLD